MTQHTGDTINKLTEAVERAEKNSKPYPRGMIGGVPQFNATNIAHVLASNERSKISTQFLSYMPSAEAWQATGPNYEPGFPIGTGATEEAAIADLEEKEKWERYSAETMKADFERDIYRRCDEEDVSYPGRAFPQVEDESDLQSMLDGLMSEHERGN